MKFKTTKKFSLNFLGEDWKKAYINLSAVTIADIKDKFPKFKAIDTKSDEAVAKGIDDILGLLEEKFVSGKAVAKNGSLVDLKREDLKNLPTEVLSKALGFLSAGVAPAQPKP